MRLTATLLAYQFRCPFLRFVLYEARQPLPLLGRRRRFGNLLHAAIAAYERHGRSLRHAYDAVGEGGGPLPHADFMEIRRILQWRHSQEGREGRPFLVEGPLSTSVAGHPLHVRMDRLDRIGEEFVLVEYKSGKRADLAIIRAQLAILSYAVLRVLGRPPRRWRLELLGARQILDLPAEIDPGALERFTSRLAQAVAEGDCEPRPFDPAFCKRCPVRAYCPRETSTPKAFTRSSSRVDAQLVLF